MLPFADILSYSLAFSIHIIMTKVIFIGYLESSEFESLLVY